MRRFAFRVLDRAGRRVNYIEIKAPGIIEAHLTAGHVLAAFGYSPKHYSLKLAGMPLVA